MHRSVGINNMKVPRLSDIGCHVANLPTMKIIVDLSNMSNHQTNHLFAGTRTIKNIDSYFL